MSDLIVYILIAIASYGVGSIPFALIFSKVILKEDLRNFGSKNTGALNTFRLSNKKHGFLFGTFSFLLVFLLDAAKAILAVYMAMEIGASQEIAMTISTFFVVLGHNYSIFLNFKGGRGAASFIGILLFFSQKAFLGYLIIILMCMLIGEAIAGRNIDKNFIKHSISDQIIGRLVGEIIGILWIGTIAPQLLYPAIVTTPLILIAHKTRINNQLQKINNKTYLNG